MTITPTGIYVALIIVCITLPRALYLAITNVKRYPCELFSGVHLFLFLISFLCILAAPVSALFFSNDFFYAGIFFLWAFIAGVCLCLYSVLWVIFWMHGYEARWQFSKVIIPAPMSILASLTLLASGITSLNYSLIGIAVLYAITSYLWNLKGYKLTKPKIPDYIPIKEKDYMDD